MNTMKKLLIPALLALAPLTLTLLDGGSRWVLLGLIWGIAAFGIVFRICWVGAPRWLSTLLYVAMGWAALGWLGEFWTAGGPAVVLLMLAALTPELGAMYEKLGFSGGRAAYAPQVLPLPAGRAEVVTATAYAGLRETALWDISHVRYGKAQLEYAVSDGTFYCLMAGYNMGCAAAKTGTDGKKAFIYEMLPGKETLPALAEKLGTGEYEVLDAQDSASGETWCMLKWLDTPYPEFEPVYMGFSLA